MIRDAVKNTYQRTEVKSSTHNVTDDILFNFVIQNRTHYVLQYYNVPRNQIYAFVSFLGESQSNFAHLFFGHSM